MSEAVGATFQQSHINLIVAPDRGQICGLDPVQVRALAGHAGYMHREILGSFSNEIARPYHLQDSIVTCEHSLSTPQTLFVLTHCHVLCIHSTSPSYPYHSNGDFAVK